MASGTQSGFEPHRAQVYAWAYRLLQNHDDALDVSQEVAIRWWQADGKSQSPAHAVAWLRRVTVNLAIDASRVRTRRTRQAPDGRLEPSAPVRTIELVKQETAGQIAAALESLTERQRSVVVAKVDDGCTFAQIAEQMGLSVPTVKTHYLRALRVLRTQLAPLQKELGDGHGVQTGTRDAARLPRE
jgi:RNA polymerase sigma-70 factor (ECF subfamily)